MDLVFKFINLAIIRFSTLLVIYYYEINKELSPIQYNN